MESMNPASRLDNKKRAVREAQVSGMIDIYASFTVSRLLYIPVKREAEIG